MLTRMGILDDVRAMEEQGDRKIETLVLWSGATDVPRRHASTFLARGRYRLDLLAPPEGEERPEDRYAWSAWRPTLPPRYINRFTVYSPTFPLDSRIKDRRRDFGTGIEYPTQSAAVAGFMALADEHRTIEISASHGKYGHPVLFFIHDEQDHDNQGGLTIVIVPV